MKTLFYAARPIITDMISTILFAALFALTDNVVLSTGAAVALGVGQVGIELLRGKPVPGMQWASLGLVTILGAATLFTGDARFVMAKPTIVYLTIGAAMLQRGWMERYMPPAGRAYLPTPMVEAWGYAWSALMFVTAAANLVVAVGWGHKAWLMFIGFFPLASKLGLFAITYLSFRHVAIRNRRAADTAPMEAQPA